MTIRPSAIIRQNYNEIAELCRASKQPVYLTKNSEGELVVMDIEAFEQREKMLELSENLFSVEDERLADVKGVTVSELDDYLDGIIGKCDEI